MDWEFLGEAGAGLRQGAAARPENREEKETDVGEAIWKNGR